MTTAFTIFATKVGKERRIPFEITAEPHGPAPRWERCAGELPGGGERAVLTRKQERLEMLCANIRRSLTAIHTAIPSSVTGLYMERIRLLCGDELKGKAAGVSRAFRSLFSEKNAETLGEKDLSLLDEYTDALAAIGEELREVEDTLVPTMRAWSGGDAGVFAPYEQRLCALSQDFDGLQPLLQRFLRSTARRCGGARSVQARIRQAAANLETSYVTAALDGLQSLVLQHYDALEDRTKTQIESDYLQTLELTLEELGRAEASGAGTEGKAALCLRAVNVISQVISQGRQTRQELQERSLEAEVAALERLAAMRGDTGGELKLAP